MKKQNRTKLNQEDFDDGIEINSEGESDEDDFKDELEEYLSQAVISDGSKFKFYNIGEKVKDQFRMHK